VRHLGNGSRIRDKMNAEESGLRGPDLAPAGPADEPGLGGRLRGREERDARGRPRARPPEAVYAFPGGSPSALVYGAEDLRHRVVIFTGADTIPASRTVAAAVRTLAEHQELRYVVTRRDPRRGTDSRAAHHLA